MDVSPGQKSGQNNEVTVRQSSTVFYFDRPGHIFEEGYSSIFSFCGVGY